MKWASLLKILFLTRTCLQLLRGLKNTITTVSILLKRQAGLNKTCHMPWFQVVSLTFHSLSVAMSLFVKRFTRYSYTMPSNKAWPWVLSMLVKWQSMTIFQKNWKMRLKTLSSIKIREKVDRKPLKNYLKLQKNIVVMVAQPKKLKTLNGVISLLRNVLNMHWLKGLPLILMKIPKKPV